VAGANVRLCTVVAEAKNQEGLKRVASPQNTTSPKGVTLQFFNFIIQLFAVDGRFLGRLGLNRRLRRVVFLGWAFF
jgi:hypothetical protein